MRQSIFERIQEELTKRKPLVPESPVIHRKSKRRPAGRRSSAGYSVAHSPGLALPIAELGVNAISLVSSNNDGDISWELDRMEGTFHPGHQNWSPEERELYRSRSFRDHSIPVDGPIIANAMGVETFCTLKFLYKSNGSLLADLLVMPGKQNDPPGFGLKIIGRLNKDQNAPGNVAQIQYIVTYNFTRSIGQNSIWEGTFEIKADGSFALAKSEWIQFRASPTPFSGEGPTPDSAGQSHEYMKIVDFKPPAPDWLRKREEDFARSKAFAKWPGQVFFSVRGGKSSGREFTKAQALENWDKFFPFPVGSTFKVDGPGFYNGTGELLEKSDTVLKFKISVPDYDMHFECTYQSEGAGNKLKGAVNRDTMDDKAATIRTEGNKRTIAPSVLVKGETFRITLQPVPGNEKIDMDIEIGKQKFNFILEEPRKKNALGLDFPRPGPLNSSGR